jgi:hypothetical protein
MNAREPEVKWFKTHGEALDYSVELELKGFEVEVNIVGNTDIGGYVVVWFE